MQYNVILADPPWRYNNSGCRGAAEGGNWPLEKLPANFDESACTHYEKRVSPPQQGKGE